MHVKADRLIACCLDRLRFSDRVLDRHLHSTMMHFTSDFDSAHVVAISAILHNVGSSSAAHKGLAAAHLAFIAALVTGIAAGDYEEAEFELDVILLHDISSLCRQLHDHSFL